MVKITQCYVWIEVNSHALKFHIPDINTVHLHNNGYKLI